MRQSKIAIELELTPARTAYLGLSTMEEFKTASQGFRRKAAYIQRKDGSRIDVGTEFPPVFSRGEVTLIGASTRATLKTNISNFVKNEEILATLRKDSESDTAKAVSGFLVDELKKRNDKLAERITLNLRTLELLESLRGVMWFKGMDTGASEKISEDTPEKPSEETPEETPEEPSEAVETE